MKFKLKSVHLDSEVPKKVYHACVFVAECGLRAGVVAFTRLLEATLERVVGNRVEDILDKKKIFEKFM